MNLLSVTALILMTSISPNGDKPVKLPKYVKNNFTIVPAGMSVVGDEKIETEEFYLAISEVSNIAYAEYLADVELHGSEQQKAEAQIANDKWNLPGTSMSPFAEYYHKHPAYHDYPVVNITRKGAEGYCKWLAEIYTEAMPDGYHVEISLPTRHEWIRAAQNEQTAPYSWGGSYLRNDKGTILCNFKNIGAENISQDIETGEFSIQTEQASSLNSSIVTAPCLSFVPNSLGLYNLNGNVAEMVKDGNIAVGGSWNSTGYDVRNESTMTFVEASPFVGFRPLMRIVKD